MHQVSLVEEVFVEFDGLRVLHQDVTGLTDAGQQFMQGLCGVNHGMLGTSPVLPHRMVAAVKRMEGGMRQPGFIKVDVLHIAIEQALHGLGVVQHTVVG